MTRERLVLLITLLLSGALLIVHSMAASWLADHDPIAALLVERDSVTALTLVALLGTRVVVVLLPGWLLYALVRFGIAEIHSRRSGRQGLRQESDPG